MARTISQIYEIAENVERFAGEDVRTKVMEGSEQIKASSKPEKVARWVQVAMQRLDDLVDVETRSQIMTECGYNCACVNAGPIMRARARRKKFKSIDDFLTAEQQSPPPGMRFQRKGKILYQFYTPRSFTRPMCCYCSLFRGLPEGETASPTYCQCSRGFVQRYWEGILERPVKVELLESCVSGEEECKFVIHL